MFTVRTPCPSCRAEPGDGCSRDDGTLLSVFHPERDRLSRAIYAAQAAFPSVRAVQCPLQECEAAPGKMCRWSKGGKARDAHDSRRRALAQALEDAAQRAIDRAMKETSDGSVHPQ